MEFVIPAYQKKMLQFLDRKLKFAAKGYEEKGEKCKSSEIKRSKITMKVAIYFPMISPKVIYIGISYPFMISTLRLSMVLN